MPERLKCPECGFWAQVDKVNFESAFTWLMMSDDGKSMHCPKCVRKKLQKLAPLMEGAH